MPWLSPQGRSAEPHYGAVWEPDIPVRNGNHGIRDLRWKDDWLHIVGGRKLLQLIPDEGLWRVQLPNGKLTGVMNRTRAKDTAMAWALRICE